MRVVINRLSASGPLTGVGHYTQGLCEAIPACAGDNAWDLFPNALLWPGVCAGRSALAFAGQMRARFDKGGGWGLLRGVMRGARWAGGPVSRVVRAEMRRYVQNTLSPRNYDLYHEPNFLPIPCDLPTAITIHDLSVLLYPQWHPAARVARYERAFRAGLERSSFVFASSEHVRLQLMHLLNVPADRVRCLYPGVRANMRPLPDDVVDAGLRRLGLSRGYFLYVGTIEPRKNLLMLLKAYCSLPRAVREKRSLVLAGPWGWGTKSVASYFEMVARHEGVRHLGYVPEAMLPILYNGACCLAYPSHYEGFGLPPIEMSACGGRVLASDIATLNETLGPGADFIAPSDADGWRAALLRAAAEPVDASARAQALRTASTYSWHATATSAWESYAQIAAPRAEPRTKAAA